MKLPRAELELTRAAILSGVDHFAMRILAAILVVFLLSYAFAPYLMGKIRSGQSGGLTILLDDPPAVEPLILRKISKVDAKRANDSVPLTAEPIPAARPFFFAGSAEDRARATDCLAATIFYEAGNETVNGQMAVVQVVLNRLRHPAYPKTVCGVVFQGHERSTGCQFSYTCDGSMVRRPAQAAWDRFRALAGAMLNGLVYSPVGLATHYHTDWVLPVWSAKLDKVRVEGTHLFFRYDGYWGSPKAFSGKPATVEPSFAKMAGLSGVHGGKGLNNGQLPVIDTLTPELASLEPDRISETLGTDDKTKDTFIIYIDPLLDATDLTDMAGKACGSRKRCKVLAWADLALMPRGLPIEPKDRESMAFSYIRSGTATGTPRWNCALFPRANDAECL